MFVFLDMDGVLNSAPDFKRHERDPINFCKLQWFKAFVEENEANVVLSSTWRKFYTKEQMEVRLGFKLYDNGHDPNSWRTPESDTGFRGGEVAWYMNNMRDTNGAPLFDQFIIFDDSSDFYPTQPLVKTQFDFGLLPEHIELAERLATLYREWEAKQAKPGGYLDVDDFESYYEIILSQYRYNGGKPERDNDTFSYGPPYSLMIAEPVRCG